MSSKRAVFAVHDSTTRKNLQRIAEALPNSVSVEYLLLDRLFGEMPPLPHDELVPARDATDYTRSAFFERINKRTRPGPLHKEAFQRVLDDHISPHIAYNLRSYWEDARPDLFVCGHDRLPFVKHLIQMCHRRDVPSAVVQHGVQNLRPLSSDSRLLDYIRPSIDPLVPEFEVFKRWLLHSYGAYIFCNPYLDVVYTTGDFFTDEITYLRNGYPSFGKTDIVTAGYPEYDLQGIEEYSPEVETSLFLSGWEYEANEWDDETEQYIADQLRRIAEENDIEITVRPHPKDSPEKIERFYSGFQISDIEDLKTDIRRHDLILTVFSTGIMLGIAEGKVGGVLDVEWAQNHFEPFEDPHLLHMTASNVEVHERARRRSNETQERYLRRYCFIPALHSDSTAKTPAEYIASHLTTILQGDDVSVIQ